MTHEYICTWLGSDKTDNCRSCCGATNICGRYENALGIDPFTREAVNETNDLYRQPLRLIKGGME